MRVFTADWQLIVRDVEQATCCRRYSLILGVVCTNWLSTVAPGRAKLKLKSFPSHKGPLGGAYLSFCSPQPDTSRSCKSTDMGLVCREECLFSSQLALVPIYTAWWTEANVCEQLAQSFYVERRSRDSNLWPIDCKSDAITTTSHARPCRHL